MPASLRFLFYFSPRGQLGAEWEAFWELNRNTYRNFIIKSFGLEKTFQIIKLNFQHDLLSPTINCVPMSLKCLQGWEAPKVKSSEKPTVSD